MVAEADGEKERGHLMAEYRELTGTEEWRNLLRMDEYLRDESRAPGISVPLEVVRELIRTCRMAVRASRTR